MTTIGPGPQPHRKKDEIATIREEIYSLLSQDKTYAEVGRLLDMSPQLVAYHANYYPGKYSTYQERTNVDGRQEK